MTDRFPLLSAAHPRLAFTQDDLPTLRSLAADPTPLTSGRSLAAEFAAIRAVADRAVEQDSFSLGYLGGTRVTYVLPPVQPGPIPPPEGFTMGAYPYWTAMAVQLRDFLESLAVACAVTDEPTYAARLADFLRSLATWGEWTDLAIGVTSNLDTCHLVMGSSLAYDVLAPTLSADDRLLIAGAIDRLGLGPLSDALVDPAAWHDDNSLVLRASALLMGSLALLGESARAVGFMELAVSALSWYLANRRTTGQQEGYQYTSFSLDNLLRAADALRRVTGSDELLHDPYLDATRGDAATPNLLRWMLRGLVPGGTSLAPISDCWPTAYFAVTGGYLASALGDPDAQWYLERTGVRDTPLKTFLSMRPSGSGGPAGTGGPGGSVGPGGPGGPASAPELPLSEVVPGVGWASIRSGWEADDTLFLLVSNDSTTIHNHFDQNTFLIGTNHTWVAGDTGYRDYRDGAAHRYTSADGHSGLYVDGLPQDTLGGGRILASEFGDDHCYVVGEAAAAYGGRLQVFRRHVVAVPGSYLWMYDEIVAPEEHAYEWVMNNGARATYGLDESGRVLDVRTGAAQLRATWYAGEVPTVRIAPRPGAEAYGPLVQMTQGSPARTAGIATLLQAGPLALPGWHQAELLARHCRTGPAGVSTGTLTIGDAAAMYLRATEAGPWLEVDVDVETSGSHRVRLFASRSSSAGTIQVSIDGTDIGEPVDLYCDNATQAPPYDLGVVALEAGTCTVRFTSVGRNDLSGGYSAQVDAIQIALDGTLDDAPALPRLEVEEIRGDGWVGACVVRGDVVDTFAVRTYDRAEGPLDLHGTPWDGPSVFRTSRPCT